MTNYRIHKHINYLDGFRGLAAMLVVVSHFSNAVLRIATESGPTSGASFQSFLLLAFGALGNGAGQVGVMIFFSLSAFLMFYLYYEKPFSRGQLRQFLLGRIARIFPLYYFVVFLSFIVDQYLPFNFLSIPREDFFAHLLFYESTSVLWTIAPELVFYLVFALLWWGFSKRLRMLAIPLFGFIAVCNLLPLRGVYQTVEFFALGFFIWVYFQSGRKFGFGKLGRLAPVLFGIVFFFFLPAVQRQFGIELPKSGWQSYPYLFFVAFTFVLLIECKFIQRVFEQKFFRFLGKISFSVYLMHLLVLHTLEYYGWIKPTLVSFFLNIILVVALSTATFSLIENPARRRIREFGRAVFG